MSLIPFKPLTDLYGQNCLEQIGYVLRLSYFQQIFPCRRFYIGFCVEYLMHTLFLSHIYSKWSIRFQFSLVYPDLHELPQVLFFIICKALCLNNKILNLENVLYLFKRKYNLF